MFEIAFGAWILSLLIVAISKSQWAGFIFAILTFVIVIGLMQTCEETEREKQDFIEKSDKWSNEIRERKEYYNKKYGGVQWDAPANSQKKNESEE